MDQVVVAWQDYHGNREPPDLLQEILQHAIRDPVVIENVTRHQEQVALLAIDGIDNRIQRLGRGWVPRDIPQMDVGGMYQADSFGWPPLHQAPITPGGAKVRPRQTRRSQSEGPGDLGTDAGLRNP